MRAGLLSDLSVMGYEIYLEGETIRLRYQKPDTPPESARQLIDELRKYKAEAVCILRTNSLPPDEIAHPGASSVAAAWSLDVQPLVNWFMIQEAPVEPFLLEPHLLVLDTGKLFDSLRREIETGPEGARARMGSLQSDLQKLKAFLN